MSDDLNHIIYEELKANRKESADRHKSIEEALNGHGKRLRSLESTRDRGYGLLAGLTLISGSVGAALNDLMGKIK